MTDKQIKIAEMAAAKDHMERAMHILRMAGYTTYNPEYRNLVQTIGVLRDDIFLMQTGAYPFVRVCA
jgi:hypothetical protein